MTNTSYIICATPRSGSTLLCGLLAQTGAAGQPDSFYRPASAAWWAAHWGLPGAVDQGRDFERRYLEAALREGSTGGAIFGMRLMYENLGDLMVRLGCLYPQSPAGPGRLELAFGRTRFIHLYREDKLAQAVSLVKARQTGLWHVAPDGREVERLAPPAEPRYDVDEISAALAQFTAEDAGWRSWFETHAIAPLRVSYEHLARDPAGELSRVLEWLGLEASLGAGVSPDVARLSDAVSANWIRRYRTGRP